MKPIAIKIKMSPDKYAATKQFMEEKGLSIEMELSDFVSKLYKKHVPAPVRKYIDSISTESSERAAAMPLPDESGSERATEYGLNDL